MMLRGKFRFLCVECFVYPETDGKLENRNTISGIFIQAVSFEITVLEKFVLIFGGELTSPDQFSVMNKFICLFSWGNSKSPSAVLHFRFVIHPIAERDSG